MVAMDVTVTLTPGSTAPVGSVILPVKADVLPDCPDSDGIHNANSDRTIKRAYKLFVDFTPNPLLSFKCLH